MEVIITYYLHKKLMKAKKRRHFVFYNLLFNVRLFSSLLERSQVCLIPASLLYNYVALNACISTTCTTEKQFEARCAIYI